MDIKNGAKINNGKTFGAGRSFSYAAAEDDNSVLSALLKKQNLSGKELKNASYYVDDAGCLRKIDDLIENNHSVAKFNGWIKPGKASLFLKEWSTQSRRRTNVVVEQYKGSKAFEMLNHPTSFKNKQQDKPSTAIGDALSKSSVGMSNSFSYANDMLKRKSDLLKSVDNKRNKTM